MINMNDSQRLAQGIRKAIDDGVQDTFSYFTKQNDKIVGGCAVTQAAYGITEKPLEELCEHTRGKFNTVKAFSKLLEVSYTLLDNMETLHCSHRYRLSSASIAELLEEERIPADHIMTSEEIDSLCEGKKRRVE